MSDNISKENRSRIMAKVKSKNTTPEIIVRKYLFSKGYRYRINVKEMKGKPDVVLRKYNTLIFVNGCFWHSHDCKAGKNMPVSNVDYWRNKIQRNTVRDIMNYEELKQQNWNIIIIWECKLKSKIREKTLSRLHDYLTEILLNKCKKEEIQI